MLSVRIQASVRFSRECGGVAESRFFRVFLCVVALMLFHFSSVVYADSPGNMLSDDAAGMYRDFREVFSAPSSFDGGDWMTVAAVAGAAVASAIIADEPVRDYVQSHHTPFLDAVMPAGDYYGRFGTGYGLGSLIYLGGIIAGADDVRLTGRAVIEAHTFAMLITGVIKATAGRSRPFKQEGTRRFMFFADENPNWSFPSGHAASAFAVSSALSTRINSPWATAGLYALSTLTAVQRVYNDKHWLSDTIVGAAIGTAVGLAVGSMINDEEDRMERGTAESGEPVPLLGVTLTF
ncbi:phosphoesterase PA-phosphatase related [Chlorobium limicola DSM 245]|jgi:membrane-associated phospholipid phosphatase|uniref:Phosphoesterase PA-phosphatase related n=2 Tax=Chlorobium limicola TaxID=1092 RepID=B3EI73_CHLL2|nr:phosphatase PAP2 family protein [Chlorobium limicola]ACD89903.1 phosphoesterase PA-phosphatase related [Chlorobium limicola DSM 245]